MRFPSLSDFAAKLDYGSLLAKPTRFSIQVADWQFWITSIGLILGAVAIGVGHKLLFQIGSFVMAIGTLLVMYNILFTLMYKIKEQK